MSSPPKSRFWVFCSTYTRLQPGFARMRTRSAPVRAPTLRCPTRAHPHARTPNHKHADADAVQPPRRPHADTRAAVMRARRNRYDGLERGREGGREGERVRGREGERRGMEGMAGRRPTVAEAAAGTSCRLSPLALWVRLRQTDWEKTCLAERIRMISILKSELCPEKSRFSRSFYVHNSSPYRSNTPNSRNVMFYELVFGLKMCKT